jgi:hypothetical protein
LTPGSEIRDPEWEKVSIRIRDEQPGSYFLELRNHFFAFLGLKYLNSLMRIRDPGSGMETVRIRDPGWKKVGSGINIPDPPHCLAHNSPAQLSAEIVEGIILLQNLPSLLELGPLKILKSHRKQIGVSHR